MASPAEVIKQEYAARLKAVMTVLKTRFNNLTAEELIDIAVKILAAVDQV